MNYIDSHAYVWSNDKPLTLNSNNNTLTRLNILGFISQISAYYLLASQIDSKSLMSNSNIINEVVPATGAVAIVAHPLALCCTHEPHVPSILALDSVPVLSSYNYTEYLN